jgi:succinate dehydrogenase / fumarate reductase iron-sulfur subunit
MGNPMNAETVWNVTFEVARQREGETRHYQTYRVEINPQETVLDGIEKIWANQDRSLTFRHACHHSTCGACGMVVNGVEKLTCITPIRSVTHNGGKIRVEPLRNFPLLSDLVVDTAIFFEKMEKTGLDSVQPLSSANLPYEKDPRDSDADSHSERLIDCIECGLCISACPPAKTDSDYLGPAVLAAIQSQYTLKPDEKLIQLADCQDGAWRCHSAYECSAVCPSNVDPAWRIMNLRRTIIRERIQSFFSVQNDKAQSTDAKR